MFALYQTAYRADTKRYPAYYMREQQWPEQLVHTHRTLCWRSWPGGFCALNPSPHSRMFTSVSVGSILRSFVLESLRSYDGDGSENAA